MNPGLKKMLWTVPLFIVFTSLGACSDDDHMGRMGTGDGMGMHASPATDQESTGGTAKTGRWYTAAQVEQGAPLFATYCAACHGKEAQGDFRWRQRGADGRYPAPPLNGSAHAWHHPLPMIKRQIRDGSPPGGSMPGFGAQLSDAQIEAMIAWFQNFWSREIYQSWKRGMHHKG